MTLFESISNFLRKKGTTEEQQTPIGFCPNCWGTQEYGGQFYEALKNENVDVNNVEERQGWVQQYANKHLKGILIKKEDHEIVCSKCKITYRPVS